MNEKVPYHIKQLCWQIQDSKPDPRYGIHDDEGYYYKIIEIEDFQDFLKLAQELAQWVLDKRN